MKKIWIEEVYREADNEGNSEARVSYSVNVDGLIREISENTGAEDTLTDMIITAFKMGSHRVAKVIRLCLETEKELD